MDRSIILSRRKARLAAILQEKELSGALVCGASRDGLDSWLLDNMTCPVLPPFGRVSLFLVDDAGENRIAMQGQSFSLYAPDGSCCTFTRMAAPQPQAQPAPQAAPEAQGQQQTASLLSARVINARGMADCRSAITLLRSGDAVMIVLENITDPTEMRRLVDTLSGACYSLTATITKVSRHGVYLLAPQTLAVYTDQATNAMNSAPARPQARNYQPGYAGQRVAYSSQPMQQPQPQMQPQENPYAGQQGFTQRAAMPEEEPRNFYQRPMPQSAQTPSFSAQPVSYGYAPDEAAAGEQ